MATDNEVLLASAVLQLAESGRLDEETNDNLTYVVSNAQNTEQTDEDVLDLDSTPDEDFDDLGEGKGKE